jgi:serine/threonine protein phosphatase 1
LKERLFAIGDIHGCSDQLRELVESVIGIQKQDRIVFLGDYIDRGRASRAVVDYIMNLQHNEYNVIPLIGNHEWMLLEAYESDDHLMNWIFNGGSHTLESFEINALSELSKEYIDFFRNLRYYYLFKNYIFVHAGFNDLISDPFDDRYDMIWTRRESYSNPVFSDKIIIHGHTPLTLESCRKLIDEKNRVINIDTGCVYADITGYGHLTAIELFSMELFSV